MALTVSFTQNGVTFPEAYVKIEHQEYNSITKTLKNLIAIYPNIESRELDVRYVRQARWLELEEVKAQLVAEKQVLGNLLIDLSDTPVTPEQEVQIQGLTESVQDLEKQAREKDEAYQGARGRMPIFTTIYEINAPEDIAQNLLAYCYEQLKGVNLVGHVGDVEVSINFGDGVDA